MRKRIKKSMFKGVFSRTTILLILVTFISVVGSTYAYFAASQSNNGTITGNMATVNLELQVESILPVKESTGVMVPQKSVSGSSTSALSSALKKGCVDDNKNVVCQVYKITITNNGGSATEVVDGSISFFADSDMTESSAIKMPNLKWKLITSIDTVNNNNSVLGTNVDNAASGTPAKFVSEVSLNTNDTESYYMIVWFNEIGDDQIDTSNTFYGKVEFNSSNGTGVTAQFA